MTVDADRTRRDGVDATVSVRDLLSVRALGLRLRAAPEYVDAPVRWAHPTELIDPRPYLSGHELVLTVGTALQDEDRCRDFVDRLLEADVTALGYGVGDVTDEVPAALLQACRDKGLPLLEVPPGVPFQAITELLADRRAEARAARGRRVQRLVARLLDAIALDRRMEELTQIIESEVGGRTEFRDGVLEWWPATDADVRPTQDTLDHLAAVLAVRQHETDVEAASRRAELGRLLDLVLRGRADPEVLQHPLERAGVDVTRPIVVAAWPKMAARLVGTRLGPSVEAELGEVIVTMSSDPAQVVDVAGQLALPCGIGEPGLLTHLPRMAPPAMAALRVARDRGAPATYRDLTSFEGLLEQQPADRLAPFAEKLISPLIEHDRQHGTALVDTLRAFLDHDGSVNATAKELFLHVNSLRHRLRRIQELTGSHPQVFDERVALAIGLWAWDRRPRGHR